MPTVSLYIKDEDYAKYQAIEKKSEFIHNALNGHVFESVPTKLPEPILSPGVENIKTFLETPFRLCKHGADPKLCKFAKKGICK